jgi:Transposase, Mutator family
MHVEPCEGELHARFSGGREETRRQPAIPHDAGRLPPTRQTANCLDVLPKRLQPRAKSLLHEMAEAPTRADARKARERFRDEFDAKYPKAVSKLDKDWDALTTFYDFPAEHWRHLRTTNPIESSFATVKLRTKVTKGRRLQESRARDGLQAARCCPGALAAVQRPRARHRRTRRREVQGRNQGHRRQRDDGREGRRLMILHTIIHNI